MYRSIYDFKDFYNTPIGKLVLRVLRRRVRQYWNSAKDLRVVGIGYTQPFLDMFEHDSERVVSLNGAGMGTYPWPEGKSNLSALVEETDLPIETNSVDRVLVIHSLEFAELPNTNLQEIYRILKSNGRLLIVTPNRRGLWSRAEWSPFGHGVPYSGEQLRHMLRENMFVYERSGTALFIPPIRANIIQKIFEFCETVFPFVFSAIGGVHIVEASKQIYSGILQSNENRVIIRARPTVQVANVTNLKREAVK